MIKILTNVWYSIDKMDEVFKKFTEIEKTFPMDPSLIKPITPWETWATKTGLKGSGIFEVDDEKFEQAVNYFVRRLNMYAQAIDGYRFEIAASSASEKARTLIGKELSEFLIPKHE